MTSTTADATALASAPRVKPAAHWQDRLAQGLLVLICAILVVFLLAPLFMILVKSVQDKDGAFVGLRQFTEYFQTASLQQSILHTISVALAVTCITIPLAFTFAYALTRSCMPLKGTFRVIALTPILAPSLLAAISFIQWFGTQGLLKGLLGGAKIYGPIGIILSSIYAVFPHALMIVLTALLLADGRLYEAAESLGTPTLRRFFTITLPGAKYGLISAAMVVFSYTVSDFGIPKVIGGNFNVLALDIFKQVIGQQNFNKGAVVSLILLVPVVLAFIVDWTMQGRQKAQFSSRAVRVCAEAETLVRHRDVHLLPSRSCLLLLAVLGMAIYTSFIKLWPYDKSFSLRHYTFGLIDGGVISAFFNSLEMALLTAVFGTMLIFGGAYLLEKTRGDDGLRAFIRLLAAIPDGRTGHGARPRLHLLFQPSRQSAQRALPRHDHPGDRDDRPLLHVEPSDRGDGAEVARQRVRGGVGEPQGAVLQDLLPRDGSGLPARDPRHRPLSVRQCDGDDLRGRFPVLARYQARVARDPQSRRRRRDRPGSGDGDADRAFIDHVCLLYALVTRFLLTRTQAWRNTG